VDTVIVVKYLLDSDNTSPNVTEENKNLIIDKVDIHIEWNTMKFKFSGLKKGLRHISHWILNSVKIFIYYLFPVCNLVWIFSFQMISSSKIQKKHGGKIDSLVEEYVHHLLKCMIETPRKGFEACDLEFWYSKGFTYPEDFFSCDD